MLYGLSPSALAFKMGRDEGEVIALIDEYYNEFPLVYEWMERAKFEAKYDGKITLWTGREWQALPYAEYQAINAYVQGSSAEFTNMASIRLNKYLKKSGCGRILSIIHDEFLFSLGDLDCIPKLVEIMEFKELFGVKFLTDTEISETY